jgi:L-gulonolactone oxidase
LPLALQIDKEKSVIEAQAGISLHALHRTLGAHDLAMSNVGSISDQSLGGIITTATHGSGTSYPVISAGVLSLTLILADTTVVSCSRDANPELFLATLCGLGTTGLILRVRLQVEKAFRLREDVRPMRFDDFVDDKTFAAIGPSSEHTRAWWFPQVDSVSVGTANRTYDVSPPARRGGGRGIPLQR